MRIVLADIKGGDGLISKDTVVGGYGSRLKPFSKVTRVIAHMKGEFHSMPSVQLAYAAALATRAGHEVVASDGALADGDAAIVLSSLVDYRRETAWARAMRARGVRVGFIGLTAQKLPQLFEDDADFIVDGEAQQVSVVRHPVAAVAAGPAHLRNGMQSTTRNRSPFHAVIVRILVHDRGN